MSAEKILIVDDEKNILRSLRGILEDEDVGAVPRILEVSRDGARRCRDARNDTAPATTTIVQ